MEAQGRRYGAGRRGGSRPREGGAAPPAQGRTEGTCREEEGKGRMGANASHEEEGKGPAARKNRRGVGAPAVRKKRRGAG